jgi:hypothetical protein
MPETPPTLYLIPLLLGEADKALNLPIRSTEKLEWLAGLPLFRESGLMNGQASISCKLNSRHLVKSANGHTGCFCQTCQDPENLGVSFAEMEHYLASSSTLNQLM